MYNVLNRFLLYNLTKGVILSDYFSQQYTEIIKPISQELEAFDNFLCSFFKNEQIKKNEIIPIIKDFLNTKGKRIRPAIIFLIKEAQPLLRFPCQQLQLLQHLFLSNQWFW